MSDLSTSRMLQMYMDEAEAPSFFASFFRSPPRNFHTTEFVELDIVRDDEDVAVVVQDLTAGGRENVASVYTNKQFKPPIFKEVGSIDSFSLIRRAPGQDPFQDPNYAANAAEESFAVFRKFERKIRRSIEWMAAQVLQTGQLTLIDSGGVALYALNFQPKATHVATVGTVWATDGSTGNPIADIEALAEVVTTDGKLPATDLVFGNSALQRFLANADVKARLFTNSNSLNMGQMSPQRRGGAVQQGFIWIGNHLFRIWSYRKTFKHPQTGNPTPYLATDKMLMLSEGARLDLSFGAIPMLRRPDAAAMAFLPPRMSSAELGLDLSINAWFTPDGEHLKVSAGTRPLTIPTAIDTFASLDVVP